MKNKKGIRFTSVLLLVSYLFSSLPPAATAENQASSQSTLDRIPGQIVKAEKAAAQALDKKPSNSNKEATMDHFLSNNNPLKPASEESTLITEVGGSFRRKGTTDTTAPTIGTPTLSSISTTSATMKWGTNEPATSQIQYGLTTSYGSTTTLDTNLVTAHTQSLTGLTAGTTYYCRLLSQDKAGNLAVSQSYSFKTSVLADTTAPVISVVASSNITASAAAITWTTNEAGTTQIQYGAGVDASGNPIYGSSTTLNTSLVTTHSQSLSGLTASTLYHYRVLSKDAAGNLTVSSDSTFTTTSSLLKDAALASLVSTLLADDSLLGRADWLSIFNLVKTDGVVSTTEFDDLQTIQIYSTLYPELDYVHSLANNVILGTAANATYQGSTLGNLAAGSSSDQLAKLVNKWFLGMDTPLTSYSYKTVAGSLYVNGLSYADIRQGMVGDCYLLASLAETALRHASTITDMFIDNGDGTYTVKFYQNGVADYVTVDRRLPVDSSGNFVYANYGASAGDSNAELWTALAEKAYIQMNAKWGTRQNTYASIASGYIANALSSITGFAATLGNAFSSFTTAVSQWTSGALMGFASLLTPLSSTVVGAHAYAVVNYDSVIQKFTLFNPWGIAYGLLTLSWTEIQNNFAYYDQATGSEDGKQARHGYFQYFFENSSVSLANQKKAKRLASLTKRLPPQAAPSRQVESRYQMIGNMKIQNAYDEPLSYENAVSLYQNQREEAFAEKLLLKPVSSLEEISVSIKSVKVPVLSVPG